MAIAGKYHKIIAHTNELNSCKDTQIGNCVSCNNFSNILFGLFRVPESSFTRYWLFPKLFWICFRIRPDLVTFLFKFEKRVIYRKSRSYTIEESIHFGREHFLANAGAHVANRL